MTALFFEGVRFDPVNVAPLQCSHADAHDRTAPAAVQTEFNLRRWDELLADREVAKLEFRVETDRHGNIMSEAEIGEKFALYLDAGAEEIWICDYFGNVTFHGAESVMLKNSNVCPRFPSVDPSSR